MAEGDESRPGTLTVVALLALPGLLAAQALVSPAADGSEETAAATRVAGVAVAQPLAPQAAPVVALHHDVGLSDLLSGGGASEGTLAFARCGAGQVLGRLEPGQRLPVGQLVPDDFDRSPRNLQAESLALDVDFDDARRRAAPVPVRVSSALGLTHGATGSLLPIGVEVVEADESCQAATTATAATAGTAALAAAAPVYRYSVTRAPTIGVYLAVVGLAAALVLVGVALALYWVRGGSARRVRRKGDGVDRLRAEATSLTPAPWSGSVDPNTSFAEAAFLVVTSLRALLTAQEAVLGSGLGVLDHESTGAGRSSRGAALTEQAVGLMHEGTQVARDLETLKGLIRRAEPSPSRRGAEDLVAVVQGHLDRSSPILAWAEKVLDRVHGCWRLPDDEELAAAVKQNRLVSVVVGGGATALAATAVVGDLAPGLRVGGLLALAALAVIVTALGDYFLQTSGSWIGGSTRNRLLCLVGASLGPVLTLMVGVLVVYHGTFGAGARVVVLVLVAAAVVVLVRRSSLEPVTTHVLAGQGTEQAEHRAPKAARKTATAG